MTSEAFYLLGGKFSSAALRGDATLEVYSQLELAMRGDLIPETPLTVSHSSGRLGQDFLWVSLVPLISTRVVRLLTGLTGWGTYPVTVLSQHGEPINGYTGLSILGRSWSAKFQPGISRTILRKGPSGQVFPHLQGVIVKDWDGSDFFMAGDKQSTHMLTTQPVRDIFKRHKVSNVELTPADEAELLV